MPLNDSIRRSGRLAAARSLRAVEQLAGQGLARLQPVAVAEPPLPPDPPSPEAEPGYGSLWNPPDEDAAMAEIYNTTDPESFEVGGQQDFARLQPWLDAGSTVLDLGCGIGRVARYVAPACATLWAVDASPRMLELAAHRLRDQPNVRFAACEETSVPAVASASVDLAYSLLVLQHVEREDAFLLLEELRRILRPSGHAVLTFPNLLSEDYLDCFVRYAHEGASTQRNRARLYTPQEVECVMGAAGFEPQLEVGTEIRVVATVS